MKCFMSSPLFLSFLPGFLIDFPPDYLHRVVWSLGRGEEEVLVMFQKPSKLFLRLCEVDG